MGDFILPLNILQDALHSTNPRAYLQRHLDDVEYERFEELVDYAEEVAGIYNIENQIDFIIRYVRESVGNRKSGKRI